MTVKQEFQTGSVGWEVLFIFIAGMIGDMFVHLVGKTTSQFQGLNGYYASLETNFFGIDTPNLKPRTKQLSAWFQGAIWGGIACAAALLIAKLFLFAKEETEGQ